MQRIFVITIFLLIFVISHAFSQIEDQIIEFKISPESELGYVLAFYQGDLCFAPFTQSEFWTAAAGKSYEESYQVSLSINQNRSICFSFTSKHSSFLDNQGNIYFYINDYDQALEVVYKLDLNQDDLLKVLWEREGDSTMNPQQNICEIGLVRNDIWLLQKNERGVLRRIKKLGENNSRKSLFKTEDVQRRHSIGLAISYFITRGIVYNYRINHRYEASIGFTYIKNGSSRYSYLSVNLNRNLFQWGALNSYLFAGVGYEMRTDTLEDLLEDINLKIKDNRIKLVLGLGAQVKLFNRLNLSLEAPLVYDTRIGREHKKNPLKGMKLSPGIGVSVSFGRSKARQKKAQRHPDFY